METPPIVKEGVYVADIRKKRFLRKPIYRTIVEDDKNKFVSMLSNQRKAGFKVVPNKRTGKDIHHYENVSGLDYMRKVLKNKKNTKIGGKGGKVMKTPSIIKIGIFKGTKSFWKPFLKAFKGKNYSTLGKNLGGTAHKALDTVIKHPWRTAGIGIGVPYAGSIISNRLKKPKKINIG